MIHPKQHISDLAAICLKQGVTHVIISPGSRNAPLMRAFFRLYREKCISVVDERSAAYLGLGIARQTGTPVALLCTSGTAVLNYGPAMAEAYYQNIPLLAVTADRPPENIGQLENQTIRQNGVFDNYSRYGCQLPGNIHTAEDLSLAHRLINEAILAASSGPAHINIPLSLPLYDDLPDASPGLSVLHSEEIFNIINTSPEMELEWQQAKRIMIVDGQHVPDLMLSAILNSFAADPRVIIIAENIANVASENVISHPELILGLHRHELPETPDLIIHCGQHIVSRRLSDFLKDAAGAKLWRIDPEGEAIDTFGKLSRIVKAKSAEVLSSFSILPGTGSDYRDLWFSLARKSDEEAAKRFEKLPFSDIKVTGTALGLAAEDCIIELGNSGTIRYSQLFPAKPGQKYFSNRGVSGIDGCLSTAVGSALASGQATLAILGDLAFLYDSNALWNRALPDNLRILVINNRGGGIFHQIKGSSEQEGFTDFIEADHPVDIQALCGAYGVDSYQVTDLQEMKEQWEAFMRDEGKVKVMEIRTESTLNKEAYHTFTQPIT